MASSYDVVMAGDYLDMRWFLMNQYVEEVELSFSSIRDLANHFSLAGSRIILDVSTEVHSA